MKRTLSLVSLVALSALLTGCASTVSFKVKHDALKNPPATREGTLAVKPFVDTRGITNAMQIGGKWEKAKPAYLAKEKRPVADIVTDGFREALQKVGYTVDSAPAPTVAVLEGDMSQFWLTDNWGGAVCKIAVQLRLRQGDNGQVLMGKGTQERRRRLGHYPQCHGRRHEYAAQVRHGRVRLPSVRRCRRPLQRDAVSEL